jgi:hypothetical protein
MRQNTTSWGYLEADGSIRVVHLYDGPRLIVENADWMEEYLQSGERKVEVTVIGEAMISTIFLAHNVGSEQSPLWFETMVFGPKFVNNERRYATLAEAKEGHRKMAADVEFALNADTCIRCQKEAANKSSRAVVVGMCYYCGLSAKAEAQGQVILPLVVHSIGKHEMRPFAMTPQSIPTEGLAQFKWSGVNEYADHEPHSSWAEVPRFTDMRECMDYIQSNFPWLAP